MLNRPRILVADADPGICRLLRRHFGTTVYNVITVETGREALDHLRRLPSDLTILSTDLGDIEGTELVQRARSLTSAPIIGLTPLGGPIMPSQVLDSGAEDCIEKPFLLKELVARARRLLQRVGAWQGPIVLATGLGLIEVDPLERKVRIGGKPVAMTRKELDLLATLVGAKGATLSHDELVQKVWGRSYSGARQNLRRTISSLRHKIEPDVSRPTYLLSVRSSGYRLSAGSPAGSDTAGAAVADPGTDISGSGRRSSPTSITD
jgi:two-component system, OmpR family, KDP operon response regulator KdpE